MPYSLSHFLTYVTFNSCQSILVPIKRNQVATDLLFWLDGANNLVNFWNGDGGLLTFPLSLARDLLRDCLSIVERPLRDNGRSAKPADIVVVVVLTLR